MSVGIQTSAAQLNAQAGQLALNVRNNMQAVLWFNQYLSAIGGVAGLEAAPFTMSAADAGVMVSTFGNLAVVANAYVGNGLIAATFNYAANSQPFWGGQ